MVSTVNSQSILDVIDLQQEQGLKEREISHVSRDGAGSFYFFSNNNIQKFNGSGFESINIDLIVKKHFSLSSIESVSLLENQVIEFGDSDIRFQIQNGDIVAVPKEETGKKIKPIIETIYQTGKDTISFVPVNRPNSAFLWVGNKIYKRLSGTDSLLTQLPIGDSKVKFITTDKKGNIIAGFSSKPRYVDFLFVIDNKDQVHDFSELANLYPTMKSLYADDVFYRVVLVGYNGVQIISLKREGVEFIGWDNSIKQGQFGKVISGIAFDGQQIFCASESKTYYIIEPNRNTFELNEKISEDFSSIGVGQMHYDHHNDVFCQIGYNYSDKTDFYVINRRLAKTKKYVIPHKCQDFHLLNNNEIIFVGVDKLTGEGVAFNYNLTNNKYRLLLKSPKEISTIYYDNIREVFWLGGAAGLTVFDSDFKKQISFDSEINAHVASIKPFLNNFVIGTRQRGVFIVDPIEKEVVKSISEINGLTNDIAIASVEDNDGRCWISTYNGLNVIDSTFKVVRGFYKYEGLPDKEFNTRVAEKDHLGNLYFGTINGLCKIEPSRLMDWEESCKFFLSSVNIYDNNKVSSFGSQGNEIVVTNKVDSIAFQFSTNDFHKYGYSKYFVDLTCKNYAIHIEKRDDLFFVKGLEVGEYEFELKSRNQIQTYTLIVNRDYDAIAQIVAFLLSGILILSLLVFSFYKNNQRSKTLYLATERKLAELKLAALQAQMNPHFIFNSLGAIQYFIQTQETKIADDYLIDFSALMRGTLEASRKNYLPLKEELGLLRLYLNLQKLRFENKFETHILVSKEVDLAALVPPLLLQPIIENAINHGLHHLKARNGQLSLIINRVTDNQLKIEVIDNGIGRLAAQKFRQKNHESRGVQIIQDRISYINKVTDLNVRFQINDLYSADGLAVGTHVILDLAILTDEKLLRT